LFPASLSADANYVKLEIYEDVTFTGLLELTPINANRQSLTASDVTVYYTFDGTPSTAGKLAVGKFATLGGTTIAQTSIGSKDESAKFIILKRDTNYLFVNTNMNGEAVHALGKQFWIETDLTD
jgi:hypothetical protein